MTAALDVVTGAYGYTGRYLAQHLLQAGRSVRTLIQAAVQSEV